MSSFRQSASNTHSTASLAVTHTLLVCKLQYQSLKASVASLNNPGATVCIFNSFCCPYNYLQLQELVFPFDYLGLEFQLDFYPLLLSQFSALE